MSKFITSKAQGDLILVQASDYSSNNRAVQRGVNNVTVNKIHIANAGANATDVRLYLDPLSVTRTIKGTGTTSEPTFAENNFISIANRLHIGDEVLTSSTVRGLITGFNANGKQITMSASFGFTNGETVTFRGIEHTVSKIDIPSTVTCILDEPFSFDTNKYKLVAKVSGTNPNITIRID